MASNASAVRRKRPADGDVGDKHKAFEQTALRQVVLCDRQPQMARIDGHCFHTFTKLFRKPYDSRIANAMRATAADLMKHFNATGAYTFSDEITLCFPALTGDVPGQCLAFKGKILKTATLMAGYASVRFVHHLRANVIAEHSAEPPASAADAQQPTGAGAGAGAGAGDSVTTSADGVYAASKPYEVVLAALDDPQVYFDARVFNVPSVADAVENLVWRSSFDCRRNSVSGLARAVLPKSDIHGVGTQKLLAKLEDVGHSWRAMPSHYRFGTFVKKARVMKQCLDRKTQKPVEVMRSTVKCAAFNLDTIETSSAAAREALLADMAFTSHWSDDFVSRLKAVGSELVVL